MMEKNNFWRTENIMEHLRTILNLIVYLLFLTLASVVFLLMMVSYVIMDNIHDSYNYLIKRRHLTRPPLPLTTFCRIVKTGMWELKRKLYGLKSHLRWPS